MNTRQTKNFLHLPNQFREMVARDQVNPTVLMQIYIKRIFLFPNFSAQTERVQRFKANQIQEGMKAYQKEGNIKTGLSLWDISAKHLCALMGLSRQTNFSANKKSRKSTKIIKEWEQEIVPLIDYPHEMILENGQKLTITFNYFLICLCSKISPYDDLVNFMHLTRKKDVTTQKDQPTKKDESLKEEEMISNA